ncbi:unnamed protein product [Rangifer tarandus platyrhynchus]|uniref:Uncharacterized protein n=2 Tax=Rangifer tarandus platyrhynchus TaxID=3082113 RepID=A0AC59YID2_RANTA|nr:unnamed protein product [Rangifer tarandus platyrhynchus]
MQGAVLGVLSGWQCSNRVVAVGQLELWLPREQPVCRAGVGGGSQGLGLGTVHLRSELWRALPGTSPPHGHAEISCTQQLSRCGVPTTHSVSGCPGSSGT